jgi:hypothetical protein
MLELRHTLRKTGVFHDGTRERLGNNALLTNKKFLIFYTIEKRVIWVHRIMHGARNYMSLL